MKNIPILFGVLALVIAAPAYAAQLNTDDQDTPQFTRVIDDLPLMPGLQSIEDSDVLFEDPQAGRIAETAAEGNVTSAEVYKFYGSSLPQLGWKPLSVSRYQRNNEILRISIRSEGDKTVVDFTVRPASK